ncbi:MAG: hypothetical protein WDO18_01295 [Acidobacteriota bacterium]
MNGKTRKVITQASKNGFFWVLDRATGEYYFRCTLRSRQLGAQAGREGPPRRNS